MALNSKLIQRIAKTTSADVAHSTDYARIQSGEHFGAAQGANQSFEDRVELEKNRQIVQAYSRASVAQQRNFTPKATLVEERALANAERATREASSFSRMPSTESRSSRIAQIEHRAARTERFAGGVKTFEGGPKKFTGGTGITPRSDR